VDSPWIQKHHEEVADVPKPSAAVVVGLGAAPPLTPSEP